jgi:hypothetical protein
MCQIGDPDKPTIRTLSNASAFLSTNPTDER